MNYNTNIRNFILSVNSIALICSVNVSQLAANGPAVRLVSVTCRLSPITPCEE